MHIFKLGPFLQVESRLPKLVVAECFGNMGLLKAMLSPCVWNSALSLSFSLCLSLALYLIIVVPCSHLWLFCLPNLQLRTRIAAIKALCDQQKGWVRWLGPGIVIHIYMNNLGWHAHPAFSPTSGSLLLPNDDILRRDKYEKQVKLYWVELKIGGRKLMLGYV